jgi:hypothetical protein
MVSYGPNFVPGWTGMIENQQMIQETDVPQDFRKSHTADAPPARPSPTTPAPADDSAEASDEHEGGTEDQVGDLTGPGAGYDDEPEKVKNDGGVAES